jgi:hypothetical protein
MRQSPADPPLHVGNGPLTSDMSVCVSMMDQPRCRQGFTLLMSIAQIVRFKLFSYR